MVSVWEGSIVTLLSTNSIQVRTEKTTPVTVQVALERLRNSYPLMPFIKQERSLENMAPDLKFQFQILTLKQYIYLVVS